MGKIIRDHDQLARILRVFRSQGKNVVFANGCYDLVHVGHIRALIDAASRGHYLVIGINSDSSVRRLKGSARPVQPEMERAEILSAIEGVDYVTIFDEDTADEVIRRLRPTAVAKGPDYTMKNLPEAATLEEIGAELLNVGDPKDHSTVDLLTRIIKGKAAKTTRPRTKAKPRTAAKKTTKKSVTKKKAAAKKTTKKKTAAKKVTRKKAAKSKAPVRKKVAVKKAKKRATAGR